MYKVKNELGSKIMVDLFKEVTLVFTKSKLHVIFKKPLPTLVQIFFNCPRQKKE